MVCLSFTIFRCMPNTLATWTEKNETKSILHVSTQTQFHCLCLQHFHSHIVFFCMQFSIEYFACDKNHQMVSRACWEFATSKCIKLAAKLQIGQFICHSIPRYTLSLSVIARYRNMFIICLWYCCNSIVSSECWWANTRFRQYFPSFSIDKLCGMYAQCIHCIAQIYVHNRWQKHVFIFTKIVQMIVLLI